MQVRIVSFWWWIITPCTQFENVNANIHQMFIFVWELHSFFSPTFTFQTDQHEDEGQHNDQHEWRPHPQTWMLQYCWTLSMVGHATSHVLNVVYYEVDIHATMNLVLFHSLGYCNHRTTTNVTSCQTEYS